MAPVAPCETRDRKEYGNKAYMKVWQNMRSNGTTEINVRKTSNFSERNSQTEKKNK